MIISLLLNVLIAIVSVILSWLPTIDTLPTIVGYDVDGAFTTAMGQVNSILSTFWMLQYVFSGFLIILGYYIAKITLKFFFGNRSPVHN